MESPNFKTSARRHKSIAIGVTVLFHVALFGMLGMGSSINVDDVVPKKVKQWFDKDKEDTKKEADMERV